jgi:RNA polymerase sigma-70 factor (ECF subfamily)
MTDERDLTEDFGAFYRAHLDLVLAFCLSRSGDPELAADLAAEVFAAALIGRDGYRSDRGQVRQWLLGIAAHKVADMRRRGHVERRAQHDLGMLAIEWTEMDLERVSGPWGRGEVVSLLGELPADQVAAIQARVMNERPYAEIAKDTGVSQQAVRKRVSRGLATLRAHLLKENR